MKRYLLAFSMVLLVIVLGCQEKTLEITALPVPAEKPKSTSPTTGAAILIIEEVQILGKAGFTPAELSVGVGDQIIFTNKVPEKKAVVLTFQKEGTPEFITSESIPPGGSFTIDFTQPGVYKYWTVGYGVNGKVIVR